MMCQDSASSFDNDNLVMTSVTNWTDQISSLLTNSDKLELHFDDDKLEMTLIFLVMTN